MRTFIAAWGAGIAGFRRPGRLRRHAAVAACCVCLLLCAAAAPAQDDVVRLVEARQIELKEKEKALKQAEERLNALRKDVEQKIALYTKLLAQVETALKSVEKAKGENIDNVVKAYEVMPAEDAAARLSALDDKTALAIMTRMKSKKAGAVIAVMAPDKAAALTKNMATLTVKKRRP